MTRRLISMAVFTVMLAGMPAGARAQEPGHPGIPGMMGGPLGPIAQMAHVLQQLGLTQAQGEQIHALIRQATADDEQTSQIHRALQQLHAALLADVPDQQAIDTIKTTLNAANAAELDRHIELMQKVAQILTPDQRQQLLTMHPPEPGK